MVVQCLVGKVLSCIFFPSASVIFLQDTKKSSVGVVFHVLDVLDP